MSVNDISFASSSSRPQDRIAKQKKFLVDAITEAQHNEFLRQERFESCKKKAEKDALESRFAAERLRDQEKVGNLVNDFNTLKDAYKSGAYEKALRQSSQHSIVPQQSSNVDHSKFNRFRGLEKPDQVIFFTSIIEKFDKASKKGSISKGKFDMEREQAKLNLLKEKKSILSQLVEVQRSTETASVQKSTASTIIAFKNQLASSTQNTGRSTGRTWSTDSTSDAASLASGQASWATFASKSNNNVMSTNISKSTKHLMIPKLPLNKIT